ncbi:hypothetical protein L0Y59_02660 [Candidatus Uhrbacteria bacterium]|nr:hypothetical protein [Candidatus Uhrbacteria bacterium]
MPRTLAILLVLAFPALAQSRQPFPDDYEPSPCASAAPVCKTFRQSQFADIAALRGFDIGQEWVDAHWSELSEALAPSCAKIATCFATNGYTFCNDIVSAEVFATTCNRYPEGSVEREKCSFFVRTYLFGHDRNSPEPWKKIQDCAKAQPATGERTLDWWISPATIGPDYDGSFRVYAIDGETRVPVLARLHMDVKPKVYATDAPNGLPSTFYAVPWKPKLVRVPNAAGHRDVVPPEVSIEAEGYKPVSFRLAMDVPQMTVRMDPDPSNLKRGRNTVTITASDAVTGEPVEARVMGGSAVLGKTNVPFELEIVKGQKRPEIWVTSLYDRYSDVVVAPPEQ